MEVADAILKKAGPDLKWVKVGLQFFTRYGPDAVRKISDMGYKIFLDLKLHDIPNQIASSVHSLSGLPISFLSLHASGGREMLKKSYEMGQNHNPNILLTGITVLTTMNQPALEELGINAHIEEQVKRLAKLALEEKIPALVCSPLELPMLRNEFGTDPILITPGVRPLGAESFDQKRVMTPSEAAKAGASFIVVGRPILKAEDPRKAVQEILQEIK